ncbi:uncharacterized protein KY384_008821 [Bacidia gigantensis]|uniref:uncharacterized protein n=1 Tax=Bacidia gigantensis TaxID=2732470 RepID=UPI001D03E976|nr:uncharacterized protein KY384_008821 [Bacidia gigantensis]KAG8526620.1 hypothetical protein KY384_008821 [Bacidia gigantensis]
MSAENAQNWKQSAWFDAVVKVFIVFGTFFLIATVWDIVPRLTKWCGASGRAGVPTGPIATPEIELEGFGGQEEDADVGGRDVEAALDVSRPLRVYDPQMNSQALENGTSSRHPGGSDRHDHEEGDSSGVNEVGDSSVSSTHHQDKMDTNERALGQPKSQQMSRDI